MHGLGLRQNRFESSPGPAAIHNLEQEAPRQRDTKSDRGCRRRGDHVVHENDEEGKTGDRRRHDRPCLCARLLSNSQVTDVHR